MNKYGLFSALLGASYLIFKIWDYTSGNIGLMSFLFGLIVALYFIFTGFDDIFEWKKTRHKLYQYGTIFFSALLFTFVIAFIVQAFLTRG